MSHRQTLPPEWAPQAAVMLTWPRQASGPQPVSGGVFGLLSGLCFGFSLNAFRHATLALDGAHPVFAAIVSVAVVAPEILPPLISGLPALSH